MNSLDKFEKAAFRLIDQDVDMRRLARKLRNDQPRTIDVPRSVRDFMVMDYSQVLLRKSYLKFRAYCRANGL